MDSEPTKRELAATAALANDFERAYYLIEELLSLDPDDARTLLLKGNVLELEAGRIEPAFMADEWEAQKRAQARSCYERVLALNPENADALLDMADLARDDDQIDDCIAYISKALPILREQGDLAEIQNAERDLRIAWRMQKAAERANPRRRPRGFAKRSGDQDF